MTMSLEPEAVVIGTGFGGAVTACRLAQAGIRTVVLERGRRYPAPTFPRNTSSLDGWLWGHDRGLFDVRPANDVFLVQAAGYGGGSLIYANVHFRPPVDVFKADVWLRDEGFCRAGLDPYFDLAAHMLEVSPIDEKQPKKIPPKTELIERAANKLGRQGQNFRPNLAVDFGPIDAPHLNRFGVEQQGCRHCGECDIGCNFKAKNTLDLNYLAVAEHHGAQIHTEFEVRLLRRNDDGSYLIEGLDHHREPVTLRAPKVFVCGGAINSTELLLRSRDTLNEMSSRLGEKYSANGDLLGFVFKTTDEYQPSSGPTITTATVYDNQSATNPIWFTFQDGGYPRELMKVIQLFQAVSPIAADLELAAQEVKAVPGPSAEPTFDEQHSAVFLCMGRDHSDGVIDLIPGLDRAHVHWNIGPDLPLYSAEIGLGHDFARALGGEWVDNPTWRLLRQPVSVHNLGGCPMGADISEGVVGPDGGVFNNPHLYVIDGSILPSATGANPSATIAAVAEKCVERVIRTITGDQTWTAPERASVVPPALPEDAISIPATGTPPPLTPSAGLRFRETMRGSIALTQAGATRFSRPAGTELDTDFDLTISSTNLIDFLADPLHPASADGTIRIGGVTPDGGAPVMAGGFNLFTETGRFYQRQMLYRLPFHLAGGAMVLTGHKDVWETGRFSVWPATTTLYVQLSTVGTASEVLAEGTLKLDLPMLLNQLSTMRITGVKSLLGQAGGLTRFAGFFGKTLTDVFVRSKLPS